jgi:DNA-binding MarR family transcriptional regulator
MPNTVQPDMYWGARHGSRRQPRSPSSPLIARLDAAIQTLASLAARPQFHAIALERAGLLPGVFPEHPARSIDPALYGVLLVLHADAWAGPSALAAELGLHPSTICHHLVRLEERGLIHRRRAAGDGRMSLVSFTEPGILGFETVRNARHPVLSGLVTSQGEGYAARVAPLLSDLARDVRRMHAGRERAGSWH